jgi:copper transport protein
MSLVSAWTRRAAAVVAVLFLVIFGGATAAGAHAVLLWTNPANGSTIKAAPAQFVLTFDEAVDVNPTTVRLYDGAGKLVPVGAPYAVGAPGDKSAKSVAVSFPNLAHGRYLIRWRTITSDDFHAVDGSVTFGVGVTVTAAQSAAARGDGNPIESGIRTFVFLGYMLVVGAFELLLLLRRALNDRPTAIRTATRGMLIGAAAAIGGLIALAGYLTVRTSTLPSGSFLKFWGVALISVAVLAFTTRTIERQQREGRPIALLALVGVLTSVAAAWGLGHLGHGAATSGALVTTLHLISTACWAGGVALLVPMAIAAVRGAKSGWARHIVKRFTLIAVPALGLSIFSGALMARGLVPSWGGLLNTTYGATLLIKIALVGAAMALGAFTFMRTRRGGADKQLASRLMAELTAIVVIVVAAAALSGGQPPNDPRWQPRPFVESTTGTLSTQVDDLMLAVALTPSTPGDNFANVQVFQTRRPTPAPVHTVLVSLDGSAPRVTAAQSSTEWLLPLSVVNTGRHTVAVTVQRPGYPDAHATFGWNVGPNAGTHKGGAPMAKWWALLAIATAIVGFGIAVFAWIRRRPKKAQEVTSAQDDSTRDSVLV